MAEKATQILSGWKEIANYLGKGVRTVQRYERRQHLPIHRPAGKSLSAVIAIQAELDRWVTGAAAIQVNLEPKVQATFNKTNRVGADFLRVDCEIALTLTRIALEASDLEKKRRAARNARTAFDTIMTLRKNIQLDDIEKEKLDANLHRLRSNLQTLGQSF